MSCHYCNQNTIDYFDFQTKKFICQNCLYLNGFITVKGEPMDIDKKYEFNINFNRIFYFKFNIYKYNQDDRIKIGIDFVYDNTDKRLFENVRFHQFNLKYPNEYSKFYPDILLKYIDTLLNFDENDFETEMMLETFDVNKLFQNMNDRNKEETLYFIIYNFLFYFDNYIKIVLKESIENILYDTEYDKTIPNFMAKKYECDTTFKIVIPDLFENETELEEKRPGKQKEMLSRPPSSYINYPNYFHFILMDNEEKQIIGYCVGHIVS